MQSFYSTDIFRAHFDFPLHAASRFPDSRQAALRFLAAIQAGLCDVRRVTAEDEGHATEILRTHADKSYSYCDALSFTVMERMGLTHAIAFDRHFREYGRWTLL